MVILFIAVYFVIALACVGLGLYLSQPGHTWATLKDDVLSVISRRSRPASTPSSCLDDIHAHQIADAFDAALEHRAMPTASVEHPGEAEPAEVVHDEP